MATAANMRPAPPQELKREEAVEWDAIVNTMPYDHFMRGNYSLLMQYCRHIVMARRLQLWIDKALAEDGEHNRRLPQLLRMRKHETHCIMTLARSMRLTQQSVIDGRRSHPKPTVNELSTTGAPAIAAAPWNDDEEDE